MTLSSRFEMERAEKAGWSDKYTSCDNPECHATIHKEFEAIGDGEGRFFCDAGCMERFVEIELGKDFEEVRKND